MKIGFATRGLLQLNEASQNNICFLAQAFKNLGHNCLFWGIDDDWFQGRKEQQLKDFRFSFSPLDEDFDIVIHSSFFTDSYQDHFLCAQVCYLNQTLEQLFQVTEMSEFLEPSPIIHKELQLYQSILAPSKYLRTELHKAQLAEVSEVFILRGGLNPIFKPGLDPDIDEQLSAISHNQPYILYTNEADPLNNIVCFLDALKLTHQHTPSIRGVVIAPDTCRQTLWQRLSNTPKTVLQHLVENTKDFVTWLDPKSVSPKLKRELLRRASLYCNPAKGQILDNNIGEAIACHCPLALSHSGSLPEYAGDSANWFHPDDSVDLARIFARMTALRQPQQTSLPEHWEQVAQHCIEHFEELVHYQNEYV